MNSREFPTSTVASLPDDDPFADYDNASRHLLKAEIALRDAMAQYAAGRAPMPEEATAQVTLWREIRKQAHEKLMERLAARKARQLDA